MECKRCLLDNRFPGITFNKEGVCAECTKFEKSWGKQVEDPSVFDKKQGQLRRILERYKKPGREFDCIIGTSGGSDSLYTLYLTKSVYGLNPLVVTVDTGFLSPEGKANVEKVCRELKVKHIYANPEFSTPIYKEFLQVTGNFCILCCYVVVYYIEKISRQHNIRLIVGGLSRRTDPFLPYGTNYINLSYLIKNCRKKGIRHEILNTRSLLLTMFSLLRNNGLSIPDYVPWDKENNIKFLEKEFRIDLGKKKYDCTIFDFANYIADRKYGLDHHFIEYCQMIRNGKLTREQALGKIHEAHGLDAQRLAYFLDYFNLTEEEIAKAMAYSKKLDGKLSFKFGQLLRSLYLLHPKLHP